MSATGKISTFRAFRNRNYSLFFSGQLISQIGTWMQRTGVYWVIFTLTHSPFMLGVTIFATQFPSFLFSLYGGIIADRYRKYKIMLVTQTASMIQAALLAILILTHHYVVWEILTLSVLLGIVNAFDMPARQPMVHEMINDKEDLPNALALNSSMNNIARLVGPALSGLVLLKFGAGICFLLNAVSFVAVIISLLLMKFPAYHPPQVKKKMQADFNEGFTYLKNTPSIGIIILLLTLMSFLVLPYDTLLPVFAKVVFSGDAGTFGYINSYIGLGAILGAIFLASLKVKADLKLILLANTVVLGIGLILFSRASNFPLAMLFAAISGFGTMSQTTICITLIQVNAAPEMRGRVMSYVAMAYFGMLPLGSLLIGGLSEKIGATNTLLIQGVIALILAAAFSGFLRKDKLAKESDKVVLEEAGDTVIEEI